MKAIIEKISMLEMISGGYAEVVIKSDDIAIEFIYGDSETIVRHCKNKKKILKTLDKLIEEYR